MEALELMQAKARRATRSRTVPAWLAWVLAAAVVTAAVGAWQVSDRAPLVWDEAARVSSGADLSYALRSVDPAGVWHWFTVQYYYPFLGPLLHGLVYLLGGSPQTSAWLPALLAYGLAGILVGRLAGALGGGRPATWLAALLFWLTPIEAKVAGGAFSETIGACVELGVVILLIDFQAGQRRRSIVGAGLLAGVASWVKYDYGLLTIAAILGSGAIVALGARRPRALSPYVGGAVLGVLMFLASMGPGWSKKIEGLRSFSGSASPGQSSVDFLGHPLSALKHTDIGYYPGTLFAGWHLGPAGEVGLTTVVALVLSSGALWALANCRARPLLQAPLVFIALWLLLYSLAGVKFPRYVAPLVPFLAAFAGVAGVQAWRYLRARRGLARSLAPALACLLAVELALQVAHLGDQFRFLRPDPAAADTLASISSRLPREQGTRELLLIGQTNEVPVEGVRLSWSRKLGKSAPGVELLAELPPPARRGHFLRTLDSLRPLRVIAIDVRHSPLDTSDFRLRFPSQPEYFQLAQEVGRKGLLTKVAGTRTRHGAIDVTVWKLSPSFNDRIKAFVSR